MFRTIHIGQALPYSMLVDPDAQFEAGMVAEIKAFGNQTVCGVSGGMNPFGIIDDYRTRSYSRAVVDEVIIAPVLNPVYNSSNRLITPVDIIAELANPLILQGSFVSNPVNCILNPKNGTIKFPAGTELNFNYTNSGQLDGIRTVVRYSHTIANIPGEDSTAGSSQVTIWITPGIIFQTDIYDTSQQYPLNSLVYCGLDGKLTTAQVDVDFPAVAMITGSPNSIYGAIEAKWLI